MLNSFYFIKGRDVAAHLEISCTNVLGLSCKGAAILEINKRRMKNDNIRKIVLTNYVTNVHKKQDCLGLVSDYFFFFVCKNNLNSRPGNWKHNIFLGLTGNLRVKQNSLRLRSGLLFFTLRDNRPHRA